MKQSAAQPASSTARHLVLVRHGRSAHVERGWLDAEAFGAWRLA